MACNRVEHVWREKIGSVAEEMSEGKRLEVICMICGMMGEEDITTGEVYYPAS